MFPLQFFVFCLFLMLLLYWRVFKGDILAPVILIHFSFIGAALLLLSGAERLEIKDFSYETTFILITGIEMFSFGSLLYRIPFLKRGTTYLKNTKITPLQTAWDGEIPIMVYILFVLFAAIVAYVQFKHEVAYVGYAGAFTEIVSDFRDDSVMFGVPQNPFVALGLRVIFVIQPFLLFFSFYNKIVCGNKWNHPFILILLFLAYIVCMFIMAGSRGRIFSILFQIMFVLAICYNLPKVQVIHKQIKEMHRAKRGISFNYAGSKILVKTGLIISLIGIPTFYWVGVLQGKKYSEMTLFEPVENYFSYGLIHLDHIVRTSVYVPKDFGGWSFPGYYGLLNKMGAGFQDYDNLPFYGRYGNTLTIFGRWYNDFGILGVIIMAFLVGVFFSWIYYRMIYSRNLKTFVRFAIAYVFFMDIVLMASYDDWVKSKLSLNGAFQIVFLYILLKIIVKNAKKRSIPPKTKKIICNSELRSS